MTDWRIGVCKLIDCEWVHARLETDEWTQLRVAEAMVGHTEETGHPCTEHIYYGDLQMTHDRWRARQMADESRSSS